LLAAQARAHLQCYKKPLPARPSGGFFVLSLPATRMERAAERLS
jgi:hypothetical protein